MKNLKVNLLCLVLVGVLLVNSVVSAETDTLVSTEPDVSVVDETEKIKDIEIGSLLNRCYKLNKKQFEAEAKQFGLDYFEFASGKSSNVLDPNIGFEYNWGKDNVYYKDHVSFYNDLYDDLKNEPRMYYHGFDVLGNVRVHFRKNSGKFLSMYFSTSTNNSNQPNTNVTDCFWKNTKAAKGYKKVSRKYGKACVIKKDTKNKLILVKYSSSADERHNNYSFGYMWIPVTSYKTLLSCLDNVKL